MMQLLKKVILAAVLTAGLISNLASAKAQTFITYSGDTTGQPVYNRPSSLTTLSGIGTAVHYETHSYMPTATTNVRIRCVAAAAWDNYIFVYNGAFNPASPLTNLVDLNDDFPSIGVSGFPSFAVTAGTTYTIVVTGFGNLNFGAYTTTISAPLTANGTTLGAPTFARPNTSRSITSFAPIYPVDAISTSATAVRYQAKTFTVPTSGLYRVQSEAVTSGFDMYTILYKGTFDPTQPLTNAVISNDDFGSITLSGFEIGLEAGQTYTFVTTGYSNGNAGDYYFSTEKLADFQSRFSGSTVGRPTTDISQIGALFNPPLTGTGDAVPFRALQVTVSAAGTYRFQLFSKTFTATAYNPFLAFYNTSFDNADPTAGIQDATTNYPLLDLELSLTAGTYTFVVSGYTNTDAGDFLLEAFGPASVTLTPVAVVKGTVQLQNFIANPPAATRSVPVTLTFRPTVGGTNVVRTVTVTSADGSYLLNIPEGIFNVGIKASNSLQRVILGVNTTSGLVTGLNATGNLALIGADSNGDNFTDISDLLLLIGAYNQVSPAAGYNPAADYNFDGTNDITDLLFLIGYYNQSGQFLP